MIIICIAIDFFIINFQPIAVRYIFITLLSIIQTTKTKRPQWV